MALLEGLADLVMELAPFFFLCLLILGVMAAGSRRR